jgi:hypothetical protein
MPIGRQVGLGRARMLRRNPVRPPPLAVLYEFERKSGTLAVQRPAGGGVAIRPIAESQVPSERCRQNLQNAACG